MKEVQLLDKPSRKELNRKIKQLEDLLKSAKNLLQVQDAVLQEVNEKCCEACRKLLQEDE